MPDSKVGTRSYHALEYEEFLEERRDYDIEAKLISRFVTPGRGVFTTYTRPPKRKFSAVDSINPAAEEALYVLVSALDEGIISTLRPWFNLDPVDRVAKRSFAVKRWFSESQEVLKNHLLASNFYSIMSSWFTEYCAFGNGALLVVDTNTPGTAFKFKNYTYGEYVIGTDDNGEVDRFYSLLFFTPHQLIKKFGKNRLPEKIKELAKEKNAHLQYYTVLHAITEHRYMDKPISSCYFLLDFAGHNKKVLKGDREELEKPILKEGFYERPWGVARMGVIGSDVYGVGRGSKVLPHARRLQEIEKGFLKAVHKTIDPPTTAPSYLRNKLNMLPGARNYVRNSQDKIESAYNINFNFQAAAAAAERIEEHIGRGFFNDIFLTAARDPNASPLKATEVLVKEEEKNLRLGPVVKPIIHDMLRPILSRCLLILARRDALPPIPAELEGLNLDYDITFTGVLAQVQKSIAAKPITNFLGAVSGVASYDQTVLDKVNSDNIVDEFADIYGVPITVLNDDDKVNQIRAERLKQQQEEKRKVEGAMMQKARSEDTLTQSQAAKNYADVGDTLTDVLGEGA
ncbi:MAG: portal protein [Desulfobacteraceae bacterium]|jgi:hypothetical protein